MAIYKLKELFKHKKGEINKNRELSCDKPKYPIVSAGRNIKGFTNNWNREGNFVCISSSGASAGYLTIMNGKFFAEDCFTLEPINKNVLSSTFGQYSLLNIQNKIFNFKMGSAQPHVYWKDLMHLKINITSLNNQQKIIDIIEPLDLMESSIKLFNDILLKTITLIVNFSEKIELMKINCLFVRGSYKSIFNGKIPFLNISAANGKVNKFVKEEPNIFPGDVTLSLDGNTGLVNNSLFGFNGYLFKIESDHYDNYILYYSLLSRLNQNIIKLHECGTTIKHASQAKNNLYVLNIPSVLKIIYKFEIFLSLFKNKARKLKKMLIKLLIK